MIQPLFVLVLTQLLFKQLRMCSQLSLIQHWVLQSKMKINFKKSSVMWFRVSNCSAGISYPISIDGIELTVTEKQKYLGLIKPGARGLRPRAPGFLKLFWSACRYACVCVCVCVYVCVCLCVRPRGH